MDIFGLPAHVLIVHAAVVLTPMAVLLTLAFALHPRSRYLTRWPTAALAVAATGSVWGARLTGGDLEERVNAGGPIAEMIEKHEERGEMLALIMIAYVVVTLVGVLLLAGPSGLVSGRGAVDGRGVAIEKGLPVLLVIASVVAMVWVMLTGDAGARAVWDGF